MNEIWILIPSSILGFENTTYYASNYGRIRSDDYIMTPTPFIKSGYLSVTIGRKRRRIHVLVATVFHPNPDNKPFVDHDDSDVTNNASSNLKWVTHEENIALRTLRAKGRKTRAKFTIQEITYIHSMKGNKSASILATELNCLPDGISKIWRGKGRKNSLVMQGFMQIQKSCLELI